MSKDHSKTTNWKRFLKIVTLAAAILIVIWVAQHYVMTRLDAHQRRIEGFYMEEKDSLDMIILGASETYNGYIPARAWEEYGITSYLYGYQANPVTLWSYQLKEIEKTQHPDILLIECNGAVYDERNLKDPAELRFMSDDMPMSKNKIDLINDQAQESKLSYYFPILKYHAHLIPGNGTVSKIQLERQGFNIMRGAQARVGGDDISDKVVDVSGDDSVRELDPIADHALRAFLEQCQESDIKHIVFVRYPHIVTDYNYTRFQRYHKVKEIVEEYGFDYIDMDPLMDDMGLSFENDFLDCEHMNLNGARKLTDYMVPYLMDRYQMTPRKQSEKVEKQWEESLEYYNRLYEYWCYFRETYPFATDSRFDLNDNAASHIRIDAYFDGHPMGIRKISKKDLIKYVLNR